MELHFTDEGQGEPIVLLHPVGLSGECWAPVVPALASQHRLIRIDLRGHGQSAPTSAGLSLADYAADVAETLQALSLSPATIVGLSFGGMVAQELAIRHPDLVQRLVVCGCPSTFPEAVRPVLAARGDPALQGGMEAIMPETITRWFTAEARDAALPGIDFTASILRKTDPATWAGVWQAISGLETKDRLASVNIPALCIAGEADPASPPSALEVIARSLAQGRLLVLAGAPHIMHVEQPEAYSAAILDFVAGNPVGTIPA